MRLETETVENESDSVKSASRRFEVSGGVDDNFDYENEYED